MVDLVAIASLFGEAFGPAKGWTVPQVARFEDLSDVESEEVVRNLRAKQHELFWVPKARLGQVKRDGWKPVFIRDNIGRPAIFMDRLQELLLVHRPPKESH
jgi:hypothetical protein